MRAETHCDYQVGGSLRVESSSYIPRQADSELLEALLAGDYCYVFNSRQMGKSSLRIRAQQEIKQVGKRCASVDMTSIGSERVTPLQWYKGLMVDLLSKFELSGCIDFKQWWIAHDELSMVQRLRLFIEEILLKNLPDTDLFIFVDEIDSALALAFPIDDFFALVRYCYNQRAENPAYGRLTWALFGVVTPSELICDRTRTPFNIGRAIELRGFHLEDAHRLSSGLANVDYDPRALIRAILFWTNGQPFLTQKICRLVSDVLKGSSDLTGPPNSIKPLKTVSTASSNALPSRSTPEASVDPKGLTQRFVTAESLVQAVVYQKVLEHWETQDDPEHLRTIRDRLLRDELRAPRLLGIYETVLVGSAPQCDLVPSRLVPSRLEPSRLEPSEADATTVQAPVDPKDIERWLAYDDSPEHIELLLSGLIKTHKGRLQVKNPIYQTIFDLSWVKTQLANLRPYARQLDAWILSDRTDDSRLLRGKALKDAQAWSQARSVGEVDHDFLMASERYDRRVMQQALKSARLKEVEKRLESERQARRKQRTLIGLLSGAFVISMALAAIAFIQTELVKRKELQAMVTTAEALYSSNQRLDALVQAVESVRAFDRLGGRIPKDLRDRMNAVLRISAVNAVEKNRLVLSDSSFWDLAISPSAGQVVTGSADKKVRLWKANGELVHVLSGHQARVRAVDFFPNGQHIISASEDGFLKIWSLSGDELRTLKGHGGGVYDVAVSPDGQHIASASDDHTVKIWRADGKLLRTLQGHEAPVLTVAFSPDGKRLASAGEDRTLKLWATGEEILGEDNPQRDSQAQDNQKTTEKSMPKTEAIQAGQLLSTYNDHADAIVKIAFSPKGDKIAAANRDSTISYWDLPSGQKTLTFRGHQGDVLDVAFSSNGEKIASASRDGTLKLWNLNGQVLATLRGHQSRINAVQFVPSHSRSQTLWSASADRTVRLWDLVNPLRTTYAGPSRGIVGTDISSDGKLIAAASDDHTLYLWSRYTGRLVQRIQHPNSVLSADFSPDGQTIVTGSWDGIARLWTIGGKLLHTLDGHNRKAIWDAVFSPDGQTIATGSIDGKVQLWGLDGRRKKIISAHTGEVRSVAFSANGQLLVSAGLDNTVKLWRIADGALLKIFRGDRLSGFIDANFSPDGQFVAASGFDDMARVWTLDGEAVAILQGHEAEVRSVSFSSDSQQLVTTSGDGQIKLWNLDGELQSTLAARGEAVWQAMFAQGDRTVVAAGEDRQVYLWDLESVLSEEGLVQLGCDWMKDYLETRPKPENSDLCP